MDFYVIKIVSEWGIHSQIILKSRRWVHGFLCDLEPGESSNLLLLTQLLSLRPGTWWTDNITTGYSRLSMSSVAFLLRFSTWTRSRWAALAASLPEGNHVDLIWFWNKNNHVVVDPEVVRYTDFHVIKKIMIRMVNKQWISLLNIENLRAHGFLRDLEAGEPSHRKILQICSTSLRNSPS